MGTTTALLMVGDGHPYDGGLWGKFTTWNLVEGDRCAWVREGKPALLAHPHNILEAGVQAVCGVTWKDIGPVVLPDAETVKEALHGKRLVLAILKGSSIEPRNAAGLLSRLLVDFEVLA